MTLIVDPYRIMENQRLKMKQCTECTYIPVWVIEKKQETTTPTSKIGYACSEHVDTVLFLVNNDQLPKT